MFCFLVQSSVNVGKSSVVHRLKTLMRKKGFDIKGVDVSNFRAAMRALFDHFETVNPQIKEVINKQSWELSYQEMKQQGSVFTKIIKDNVEHRFSQNGKSVVFHGPCINLEEFAGSDFPDKHLVKIFLDIDPTEHAKRIHSQTRQSTDKLEQFENIRDQHNQFKIDAANANALILRADKKAHRKIYKHICMASVK